MTFLNSSHERSRHVQSVTRLTQSTFNHNEQPTPAWYVQPQPFLGFWLASFPETLLRQYHMQQCLRRRTDQVGLSLAIGDPLETALHSTNTSIHLARFPIAFIPESTPSSISKLSTALSSVHFAYLTLCSLVVSILNVTVIGLVTRHEVS